MNNILNLKRRVMARIYIEYTKNLLVRHPDYFMLLVFLITFFALVSAHDVLNNIPRDNLSNALNFFMVAVRNTSWIIQILIAGFIVRTISAGVILVHRNMRAKWSIAKLMRFKY